MSPRASLPTVLCIVAMTLTACAAPAPRPAAPAVAPMAVPRIGIAVHEVRAGFYTAGQPARADWSALAAQGVTTVINLRPPGELAGRDEAAEVRAAGLTYLELPVANAEAITPEAARRLHVLVGQARGPVLLHCASGNRAGGLVALAMAQEHAMPPAQALEIGRKAGMTSTEVRVRRLLGLPPSD